MKAWLTPEGEIDLFKYAETLILGSLIFYVVFQIGLSVVNQSQLDSRAFWLIVITTVIRAVERVLQFVADEWK